MQNLKLVVSLRSGRPAVHTTSNPQNESASQSPLQLVRIHNSKLHDIKFNLRGGANHEWPPPFDVI